MTLPNQPLDSISLLNMINSIRTIDKAMEINGTLIEDDDLRRDWESIQMDWFDFNDDYGAFLDKLEERADESEGAEKQR